MELPSNLERHMDKTKKTEPETNCPCGETCTCKGTCRCATCKQR